MLRTLLLRRGLNRVARSYQFPAVKTPEQMRAEAVVWRKHGYPSTADVLVRAADAAEG